MAYEIKIKGTSEPLFTEEGEKLKEEWKEYQLSKVDKLVELGVWTGKLSDIRSFKKVPSSASNNDFIREMMTEYMSHIRAHRSKTPEIRAQDLGFFKILHWALTLEKEPPEEIQEKARQIQEAFYKEFPLRVVPDPIAFKPLYSKKAQLNWMAEPLIDRVVRQDMYAAKFLV